MLTGYPCVYSVIAPVWPDWSIYWTLGNFLKPLATVNLPKSSTFVGIFCKGVKICHFSSEIIFVQLYRHLANFFWSHCTALIDIISPSKEADISVPLPDVKKCSKGCEEPTNPSPFPITTFCPNQYLYLESSFPLRGRSLNILFTFLSLSVCCPHLYLIIFYIFGYVCFRYALSIRMRFVLNMCTSNIFKLNQYFVANEYLDQRLCKNATYVT